MQGEVENLLFLCFNIFNPNGEFITDKNAERVMGENSGKHDWQQDISVN